MPIGCGLVAKSGGWGPHSHLGRVGGTGGSWDHTLALGLLVGALSIRIGFWGISHCNFNKQPPKIV